MAELDFSDLIPKAASSSQGLTFDDLIPKKSSWSDAVTDIPGEIGHAASENWQAIKKGFVPSGQGEQGSFERLANTGKGVLGVPGLLVSPITGAARSLIGHPLAQAEHAVGTLIAPEIAAKDDPQKMYQTAKSDVDLAMSALASRGAPPVTAPIAAPLAPVSEGQQVVAAANRLSDVAGPVTVPRAIASDSMAVQRVGQGVRNIPVVGDAIPKATQALTENLGGAVRTVADQYGSGSGPNIASRVGNTIGGAGEAEAQAAANAARQGDSTVLAGWENAQRAEHNRLNSLETNSLQAARQAVGDMSPQDMGAALNARLRAGERAARANKERLYGVAGNSDASIEANSVREVRGRVAQSLAEDGWRIEPVLTPAASRMMTELDNIASLRIPNRVAVGGVPGEGDVAAVNMQGIESTRKVLNRLSQAATNDADRAASRHIIREFDNWLGDAFDNALFSGSDEALHAFRAARSANADWRTRFGYNARDDADNVINRIVTGEVTPQETANYIVGAGKVGSKGVSSRLLTRIAEATGNDPQAMQAIRGGVWNRLSQATEGVEAKAGARVSNDIGEFLNGSGRDVANRLFTPQQRQIMNTYAETLRRTEAGREHIAEVASNTKPGASEVGIGPMQELANTVLGRGGKTDEALYSAIDAYAKSGGRGDIHTLAKLVQSIPAQDKGDLAGSIIRNLGVSPRTGQFSPDVFASQWKSYTPQAKSILFGNAGPHRQALDDIQIISERLKQVGQRFGNPSGTAQNVNLLAMASGLIAAPIATITSAVGGAVAAKILASPAGASSAAKWTRAYAAVALRPSAQSIGAFQIASRNLANTVQSLGSNASAIDFMKALQTPAASQAGDQQNVPRPPSQ